MKTDPDSTANTLSSCRTKGELGTVIGTVIEQYSGHELQIISTRLRHEVECLPSPYREAFRPYANEWLFGRYHRLLVLKRNRGFSGMNDPISNYDMFRAFCAMIPGGCRTVPEDPPQDNLPRRTKTDQLFYYLLSAFTMFVLDEPGHPVGTPFPGGFRVKKENGKFLCPIRDKEEEILHSICNFCPAIQDPANI